ncbi:ankrin repeat protein [Candidatus Rhodobacter oscarellae]|uniref:Ankrin repeat protein n=1 Tax=Candidatus Rhodobacter oscarellae TaxID=1675527 RepID=A0A0J9EAM7_9RHOB|nr:ankyrin repeat domain-containing protein [Candidatus Rhodobacter lobularis]KMW59842.1 ankrin repeat protein [Candidatus Rhodobacter lobularis]
MSSLEQLRRQAKALRKAFASGAPEAVARVRAVLPEAAEIKHADALHILAREAGHASWPKLKFSVDAAEMDRAAKAERLKIALYFGQHWVVDALLSETPDLGRDNFGLACAVYDIEHVTAVLGRDPDAATRAIGVRRPMCHLAFSQHLHGQGSESDMLAVANALAEHGASANDFYNYNDQDNSPLSVLYGAIGHSNNMALGRWLLERGADPNDNESLYHATELGHHEGLRMLLDHGAKVEGTNALLRAMDFNDHTAIRMMLQAGADPNEGFFHHPSGEPMGRVYPLHQAARRMNDAEMVRILLDAGADPTVTFDGLAPYEFARVYGNAEVAQALREKGGAVPLQGQIALLARIADGEEPGAFLNPAKLPDELRNMVRAILHQPNVMDHLQRLIAAGMEWDRPDDMGVTPVQTAGWEGLPDIMAYFLRLRPDLSHVNDYGGTLLGTIIHGSENCPDRAERDHIACARLALEEGVALPKRAIELAGEEDMAEFLAEWGAAHPGQVVQDGPG